MFSRLQTAPRWVISLITGVSFGGAMTLYGWVSGDRGLELAIRFLVTGTIFGLLMGPVLARKNREALAEVGDLSRDDQQVVVRAATRGPMPAQPHLRAAVARLITYRLNEIESKRKATLVVFVVLGLLYVVLAIFMSPWWLLAAALFLVLGMIALPLTRARLERRRDQLAAGEGCLTDGDGPNPYLSV